MRGFATQLLLNWPETITNFVSRIVTSCVKRIGCTCSLFPANFSACLNGAEARMLSKNQLVMPYAGLWAVQGEGHARISSIHKTKQEAIGVARQIAIQQHSNVLVQEQDGNYRASDVSATLPSTACSVFKRP
jgi:hypothetical protein